MNKTIIKEKIFKNFKVVAISNNMNSFGLYGVILLAQDGEAYQAGHSYFDLPKVNDIIQLEKQGNNYIWGAKGFEIPEKKPTAPLAVVKEVWRI